jgi:hypothetical protein
MQRTIIHKILASSIIFLAVLLSISFISPRFFSSDTATTSQIDEYSAIVVDVSQERPSTRGPVINVVYAEIQSSNNLDGCKAYFDEPNSNSVDERFPLGKEVLVEVEAADTCNEFGLIQARSLNRSFVSSLYDNLLTFMFFSSFGLIATYYVIWALSKNMWTKIERLHLDLWLYGYLVIIIIAFYILRLVIT